MKHLKKISAVVLVLALALTLFSGCANVEKDIIGSWRESTGSLGYDFFENGTVKIHYLDFTIPVIGTNLSSDLEGTYALEKQEDGRYHMTLVYTLIASITEEYYVTIDHDILTLEHVRTGNTYTLTRASEDRGATTAAPASTAPAATESQPVSQ